MKSGTNKQQVEMPDTILGALEAVNEVDCVRLLQNFVDGEEQIR